ncbi:MAG: DUF5615 family PIN-like protein [Saprospiraceae bacterium]|nr:DUF5615 family PIN-like protein [Saprospiraceae bacterium]
MLLLDNNLSPKLAKKLKSVFPGIAHVMDFGLEDKDDREVWNCATQNQLHILTKDEDFVHLVHLRGFPPKVIRLVCGNVSTAYIENLLMREASAIQNFINSSHHGLLILY